MSDVFKEYERVKPPQGKGVGFSDLLDAALDLADYVRESKTTNTPEYMEDLAKYINKLLKVGGRNDTFKFNGKDRIIKSI